MLNGHVQRSVATSSPSRSGGASIKILIFPGRRRGSLLRRLWRVQYRDQDAAQREGDAEDADAALRLAHGRGNRARLRGFMGFLSLEERGALGGARFHHGVQLCCQGPGLVSIIRRRGYFTRRGEAIWLASSTKVTMPY